MKNYPEKPMGLVFETLDYSGLVVTLVVKEEVEGGTCAGCFYNGTLCARRYEMGPCTSTERKDGKGVIFVEVEEGGDE